MSDSAVIAFYRGTGTDHAKRRIEDIWAWPHGRLESVHDYIQWLFPLPDPSRFNPAAPLLTSDDRAAFRDDPELRRRVLRSLDLLLEFLGLVRDQAGISRGSNFTVRAGVWVEPLNRNHLRLTRLLLFLGAVGLETAARALLACLESIAATEGAGLIQGRTLQYWRDTQTAA